MDNREALTPSSGDAILKRHLFSEVARNWIKGRGHIGRAYFVRRPSRQSFGFRMAASSGPIPKAPGSAGGYLPIIDNLNPATPMTAMDENGKQAQRKAAEDVGFAVPLGSITLTECQMVNQFKGSTTEAPCFTRGYGLAFGQSERKTM